MAGKYDFDLDQGATFNRAIIIKDAANAVVNLTGHSFAGQIRTTAQSSDIAGTFAFVITNAVAGEVTWSMTSTNTALLPAQQCVYDVELTQSNGEIIRILSGYVNILSNVTR